MKEEIKKQYEAAKKIYAELGVDTDKAIERLKNIKISMHCWQGDDIKGLLFNDSKVSGGIEVTGNYPNRARNAEELRADIEMAFSLIPGKHKLILHAIYADTDEKVDLDELEPRHFERWVEWAKKNGVGLDFNPTCFGHRMSESGFTISSNDEEIRNFWIRHLKCSRNIAEYMGKELGQVCVNNFWFPDGYKDIPVDKENHRKVMNEALKEVLKEKKNSEYTKEALESKVFGIGAESYTVCSNEFAIGFALKNDIMCCLDTGHFHPTEVVSDKITSVLLNSDELLLHVSRPVRWDSDHVVIFDDELNEIAKNIVRNNYIERVHIGLDFFDASINRIAAWVIGTRNVIKALLMSILEPTEMLKEAELAGNYTKRLAMLEELKTYPMGAVWDYYCELMGVPVREKWLEKVIEYERNCDR